MFGIGQSENDAIEMLKKDHKEVDSLFDEYESKKENSKPADKTRIAKLVCRALSVHVVLRQWLHPKVLPAPNNPKVAPAQGGISYDTWCHTAKKSDIHVS